jgi:hypothetical protein
MPTFNFSNVQEGFDLLPNDNYNAALADVELRMGQKGYYYSLTFEVAHPEYDGRRLWVNASLSERALGMTKGTLLRIGVDEDFINNDWTEDEMLEHIRENCIGNHVTLVVVQEEQPNRDNPDEPPTLRNVVKRVLSEGVISGLPF